MSIPSRVFCAAVTASYPSARNIEYTARRKTSSFMELTCHHARNARLSPPTGSVRYPAATLSDARWSRVDDDRPACILPTSRCTCDLTLPSAPSCGVCSRILGIRLSIILCICSWASAARPCPITSITAASSIRSPARNCCPPRMNDRFGSDPSLLLTARTPRPARSSELTCSALRRITDCKDCFIACINCPARLGSENMPDIAA